MCVVEGCCEAKERDNGGDFVEDEKRGYVRERRRCERTGVLVQELGKAAVDALEA